MVRKKPIFNLSKILGIPEKIVKDEFYKTMVENLGPMLDVLQKDQKKAISENLKNYFIIRLVTWLESELKKYIVNLIDSQNLDTKKLFTKGEITISLSDFKILKNKEITVGRLIATNFNFQNPEEVNFVFSRLLNLDFFKTIKEFIVDPNFKNNVELKKTFPILHQNWNNLMKLFEIRNEIVHTTNVTSNLQQNYKYYETMYDVGITFLIICTTLPNLIIKIRDKKVTNRYLIEFINTKHKDYKSNMK